MAKYEMSLDLNVLNHLGINLYTKIPAVLSEAVANAYDADATEVNIVIEGQSVTISDNGTGMSNEDVNGHFLTVGYQKRKDVQRTPIFGRKPMGRKGIGKLSLFSIANIIEVQTYNGTTKDAFIINVQELKEFISKKENSKQHKSYEPTPIEPTITSKGTYIKLTEIRKNRTLSNISKIRTELSRRFDIMGEDFTVKVNGTPLSLEDRKYFEYVSKIYTYGELNFDPAKACKKLVYGVEKRNGKIKEGYSISGWIGFVDSPGNLKSDDGDDNVNKIYLFCRGKMGQEDILSSLKNSSHYNQYLVGVINVDFFDLDGEDSESDKATTSRENFNQESEEYKLLSEFLLSEIKFIGNDWNGIKEDEGVKKAIGVEPAIEDWYKKLGPDEKKVAKKVLGNINKTVTNDKERKEITKYGILAFEKLRYAKNLSLIENMSASALSELGGILSGIDELEATLYYQIVKTRLDVLNKFKEIASQEADALEKVIQEYLFKHLWLLDPAWERPTSNEEMEITFKKLFDQHTNLTEKERNARLDICFKSFAGKLVIVELKRYNRELSLGELVDQVGKYKSATEKCLASQGARNHFEIIVTLGQFVDGDSSLEKRKSVDGILKNLNARIVYYDELISGAQQAYKAYFDKHDELNAIIQLFKKLDE